MLQKDAAGSDSDSKRFLDKKAMTDKKRTSRTWSCLETTGKLQAQTGTYLGLLLSSLACTTTELWALPGMEWLEQMDAVSGRLSVWLHCTSLLR
jgi:hypothetical protein